MSNWACPRCGNTENSVPVWERASAFERGLRPDYIGCLACHEMQKLETDGKGRQVYFQ